MRTLHHNIIRLIVTVVIFASAIWIGVNRQYIQDLITVRTFAPSEQLKMISDRTKLTDTGMFYLYASRAEVSDKAQFNEHCKRRVEKTAVLGCYTNQRIYVYNIHDKRLDGVREVTTAHEMLHAAYDRLSKDEKKRVHSLIEAEIATIQNEKLSQRLALYEQTEPGERLNELHSIIGTEITNISPELERYYAKYFADREHIVGLSNAYDSVFRDIEIGQRNLITELESAAKSINTAMEQYKSDSMRLAEDIRSFNTRANNGDFNDQSEFVSERSDLLSRQNELENDRETINTQIQRFNDQKAELDRINLTAQELQKSIDSTSAPETPAL